MIRAGVTRLSRRAMLATVAGGLLATPRAGADPPAGRTFRIGVLDIADAAATVANLGAFRRGLGDLGYVEGQHFVIEHRSADDRPERFPDLAADLVRLEVDLILTRGYSATVATMQKTRTIPIVMVASGDPTAGSPMLSWLGRRDGNVTGLHVYAPPEVGGQRLRLLAEIVPGLSRVGVLWASGDIFTLQMLQETEKAARTLGVQVASLELARPEGLERAFEAALLGGRIDALIAVEDYITFTHRARIVDFVAMSRLPTLYGLREFADAGGLVAYGTDRRDLFRRAAGYVDRIVRGAKPGELRVEGPTRFELVVNTRAARTLGLTLPASVLARADLVIE